MKLQRVIEISRPRFWIYEFGAFIVGAIAAYQSILVEPKLIVLLIIFGFFFLIPANIYIYGINDIFDYETDKLNSKKGTYEALVEPAEQKSLWNWIFYSNLPFFALGVILFWSRPSILLSFLAFFFFAGQYSATPIRTKAKPVIDSLFSGLHYVATGVFAFALLSGMLPPLSLIIAGLAWTTAMHVYSAIPDIKADTDAGLQTLAMILGSRSTVFLCVGMYTLAAYLVLPYFGLLSVLLLIPYLYLMWQSLKSISKENIVDESALFKIYKKFPLLNTIVGMALFFLTYFYQTGLLTF